MKLVLLSLQLQSLFFKINTEMRITKCTVTQKQTVVKEKSFVAKHFSLLITGFQNFRAVVCVNNYNKLPKNTL